MFEAVTLKFERFLQIINNFELTAVGGYYKKDNKKIYVGAAKMFWSESERGWRQWSQEGGPFQGRSSFMSTKISSGQLQKLCRVS